MRGTIRYLLVGVAMMLATPASKAAAQRCDTAACWRECWWESGYRRCANRCTSCHRSALPGAKPYFPYRKYYQPRRARPAPDWEPEPGHVDLFLSFPASLIGGGLLSVGVFGLLAFVLHAARRSYDLRLSMKHTRRAEELRCSATALAREADLEESRAEMLWRRCDIEGERDRWTRFLTRSRRARCQ
jgi:hypothetical protein